MRNAMVALWLLSAIGMLFVLFIIGQLIFGGTEQVMVILNNQCPQVLGETRLHLLEQQKTILQRKSDMDKNAAVSKVFADRLAELRSNHQLELNAIQGVQCKNNPGCRACISYYFLEFKVLPLFYRASLAFIRASGRVCSSCQDTQVHIL